MSSERPSSAPATPENPRGSVRESLAKLWEKVNPAKLFEGFGKMFTWVIDNSKRAGKGLWGAMVGTLTMFAGDKGSDQEKKDEVAQPGVAPSPAPDRQAAAPQTPQPDRPERSADFRELAPGLQSDVSHPTNPDELLTAMVAFWNRRYEWGGDGTCGIDCSGLVVGALTRILGVARGDTNAQGLHDRAVRLNNNHEAARRGDLVFWHEKGGRVSHIAVVNKIIGNGTVQVTESSGGRGYREDRVVDLKNPSSDKRFTYSFDTPVFYG